MKLTSEEDKNPSLVEMRKIPFSHIEAHYPEHVEFWTLEGEKFKTSKVKDVK